MKKKFYLNIFLFPLPIVNIKYAFRKMLTLFLKNTSWFPGVESDNGSFTLLRAKPFATPAFSMELKPITANSFANS